MVRATYRDATGREWVTLVPPGQEEMAESGILLGPPDTSSLGLPEDAAVRLHNELASRGLLTEKDLRGRAPDVFGALQSALKINVHRIITLYREIEGGEDATENTA